MWMNRWPVMRKFRGEGGEVRVSPVVNVAGQCAAGPRVVKCGEIGGLYVRLGAGAGGAVIGASGERRLDSDGDSAGSVGLAGTTGAGLGKRPLRQSA